ncbi:MAG: hypothetical protein QOJ74_2507, partial [Ilumatobacteraceae bacterium]|nr:hypothetical protein [Ilumatobacteraceae bacterium]
SEVARIVQDSFGDQRGADDVATEDTPAAVDS